MPAVRKHSHPVGGNAIRSAEGVCFSFKLQPTGLERRSSSTSSDSSNASSTLVSPVSALVPTQSLEIPASKTATKLASDSAQAKDVNNRIETKIVEDVNNFKNTTVHESSSTQWGLSTYLFPSLTASRVIKNTYSTIFADWSRLHPDEPISQGSSRRSGSIGSPTQTGRNSKRSNVPVSTPNSKFGRSSSIKRRNGNQGSPAPSNEENGSNMDLVHSGRSTSLPTGRPTSGTRQSSRRSNQSAFDNYGVSPYRRNYIDVTEDTLDDSIDVLNLDNTPPHHRSRQYNVPSRSGRNVSNTLPGTTLPSSKKGNNNPSSRSSNSSASSTKKQQKKDDASSGKRRVVDKAAAAAAAAAKITAQLGISPSKILELAESNTDVDTNTFQKRLLREAKIHRPTRLAGQCASCHTSKTGQWRRGPLGPRTLCNACGLEWSKKEKARVKSIDGGDYGMETPGQSKISEAASSNRKILRQKILNKDATTGSGRQRQGSDESSIDIEGDSAEYFQHNLDIPQEGQSNEKSSANSNPSPNSGSSIASGVHDGEKDELTPSPTVRHVPMDLDYKSVESDANKGEQTEEKSRRRTQVSSN